MRRICLLLFSLSLLCLTAFAEGPEPETFTLSFVGDLALGSDGLMADGPYSFAAIVGEDLGYPMKNVVQYFENDDLTLGNLECVLREGRFKTKPDGFCLMGSPAFAGILSQSSIEVVSLANNHIGDFGPEGIDETERALVAAGVTGVRQNRTQVITTERGLKIGIFAVFFQTDSAVIDTAVTEMRAQGAQVLVALVHWGSENSYHTMADQDKLGQALIDKGFHIVAGSHPHLLQKISEYAGGVIYYSLGNFCFGGNHYPTDMDTAIVQQQVLRYPDGTVALGGRTLIPCCISSETPRNNFQPTPYEAGTEYYDRVISKLDGTFKGNGTAPKYPW